MSEESSTKATRLNKAIAHSGLCSRRKADELILAGEVRVNGLLVKEPGTRVDLALDVVTVGGKALSLRDEAKARRSYVLMHKPVQVVSTASDPQGRETVLDLLPSAYAGKRLYPVGRLDYFSEGLLLLTDDGELANRMTHPRHHLPKEYEVLLRERPDECMLAAMRRGMVLAEGEKLAPVEARLDNKNPKLLRLTLRQGVNRQIRRMCRDLGLTILRLRRVSAGPLSLGELPKGQCRDLEEHEIAALYKAVGLVREKR